MLKKRREEKFILDYFSRLVSSSLNNLDVTIFKEQLRIAEEHSAKGTLASGMVANDIIQMINEKFTSTCQECLTEIGVFQREKNVILKDKQLDKIAEIYSLLFIGSFLGNIERVYYENVKRYVGEKMARRVTIDATINTISNKLNTFINNKIKDTKVHNKVSKDEPSVVIARKAYRIALFSLLFSIGTFLYSYFR